ncbi:MAG: hypothetical protein WKF84_17915 [Pyrinomonadaceae bacterium]
MLTAGVILLLPRFAYLALRHRKYVDGFAQRLGGGGQPLAKSNR